MKIVVRAPNWLGDIVMSFPFLIALHEAFPEAQIAVIGKPEFLKLLELLPFPVRGYAFSKQKFQGFQGLRRFAKEHFAELGHSQMYFSLPPSFSTALMGWLLRAKLRLGFAGQWRTWLLSQTITRPKDKHRSEEYLALLDTVHTSRRKAPFPLAINAPGPAETVGLDKNYIVLNVNSEAESRRLPLSQWVRFLEAFPASHFVLIGTQRESPRVQDFIKQAPSKHSYHNLAGKTDIMELARLLAGSQGLISNDSGPAHLAALLGKRVAVFFGAGDPRNTAPLNRQDHTLLLKQSLSCSPCLKNRCPLGTTACLTTLPAASLAKQTAVFLFATA